MAKKRGGKQATAEATASPPPAQPRARRPTDETRNALAEAMGAVVPAKVGPTDATREAIAEAASPRHRSASGEIHVPANVAVTRAESSPALTLAAPVVPANVAVKAPRASSDSVIVRNDAMVAAPNAVAVAANVPTVERTSEMTGGKGKAAKAGKQAGATSHDAGEATAPGPTAADSFSDLDETFFASDVSDQTLTSEREREEAAQRSWWRRLLDW